MLPQLYIMQVALPKFEKGELPSSCKHVLAYLERSMATETFKKGSFPQDLIVAGWAKKVNTA